PSGRISDRRLGHLLPRMHATLGAAALLGMMFLRSVRVYTPSPIRPSASCHQATDMCEIVIVGGKELTCDEFKVLTEIRMAPLYALRVANPAVMNDFNLHVGDLVDLMRKSKSPAQIRAKPKRNASSRSEKIRRIPEVVMIFVLPTRAPLCRAT